MERKIRKKIFTKKEKTISKEEEEYMNAKKRSKLFATFWKNGREQKNNTI